MTHRFAEIMFTEAVKEAQKEFGSREQNEKFSRFAGPNDRLTAAEAEFIATRDTLYIATVSEDGWPYVQHRGGPPGFLKVLSQKHLAYADFRGNTQLVSVGYASKNDRVSLILMDYPNRARLKILGRMRVVNARNASAQELAAVKPENYRGLVERIIYIDVVAYDWNCPQHITPRYTREEFLALSERV